MTDRNATTPLAVAEARRATADDDLDGAPVVVAVKLPADPITRTEERDVESQPPTQPPAEATQPPLVVAMPVAPQPQPVAAPNDARTAEGQLQQQQPTVIIIDDIDPDAGKGCGIGLFVVLVVGGLCWLFEDKRFITLLCIPLALIVSCIITCGCCGFGNTREKIALNAQAFALVTVVSLSGIVVIYFITINNIFFRGSSSRPPAMSYISVGLYVVAIISSILFVWGRSICEDMGRKNEGGAG